jgi:small subunit ribosomal protein S3
LGQKVHPYGFRLGYYRTWHSRWYSEKDYAKTLHEDVSLRRDLKKRLSHAGVSEIEIERAASKLKINVLTSRPGIIIGKKGAEVDKLRDDLQKRTKSDVHINLQEIQRPETDAQLVSESVAVQLERRVAFRRAMKRAVQSAMRLGAGGIRINCSGRLGGAEIARMEWYREGRVPLHTLRADIDFGTATAKTTYGTCGVKVWIFKGEVMAHDPMAQDKRAAEQAPQR